MKQWRNCRGLVDEYRPVPKLQIQRGDRDGVSQFTAAQTPQVQVHVQESADCSDLDSTGWEYRAQVSTDSSHSPSPTNYFTEGKKIPPGLRVAPFVSFLSTSASLEVKAGRWRWSPQSYSVTCSLPLRSPLVFNCLLTRKVLGICPAVPQSLDVHSLALQRLRRVKLFFGSSAPRGSNGS